MGDNFFADLQMQSLKVSEIVETRKEMNELVDFMRSFDWQDEQIGFFAQLRNLDPAILHEVKSFMVPDDLALNAVPEKYHHDAYGFAKMNLYLIYSGRYVFPVFDSKGDVAGFVGYDKFEEPKYLDSKNYGYKAKWTMLYGMEKMLEYYKSDHVIFTEGIICCLWLRSQGFNALSTLGSWLSPYVSMIIRRLGHKAIMIPDSDETGTHFKEQIQDVAPKARVLRPAFKKDIDDARELDENLANELHQLIKHPYMKAPNFRL